MTLLALPLVLAACADPQSRCVADATRDLNIVTRLIAETEQVIARGYAVDRETSYRRSYRLCRVDDQLRYCWVPTPTTRLTPVAVDLEAERAKLRSLRAKRSELQAVAAPRIAACKAQFPQG